MTDVNDKGILADQIPKHAKEDKKSLATKIAGSTPLDATKEAGDETVESTQSGEKREDIAQVIHEAPLDTRKAAVREAVNSASPENKKDVAKQALEGLPSSEQQELAMQLVPSPGTVDQVWLMVVETFRWVLWGSALALVAAIGVALFREVDAAYVQILLTVFTTVAGIFAGFISGKALGNSNGQ